MSVRDAVERVRQTAKRILDDIAAMRPRPAGEVAERVAGEPLIPRGLIRRAILRRRESLWRRLMERKG